MMAFEEYLDDASEWAGSEEYSGPAFYVVDANGIVAGPFDDDGEASWWIEKSKRVA